MMANILKVVRNNYEEYAPFAIALSFGLLVFISIATKFFTSSSSKGVFAVGFVGLISVLVSIKVFLDRLEGSDFVVYLSSSSTLILLYGYSYLQLVTKNNLFGFSFQPTTVISITAYVLIFVSGYILSHKFNKPYFFLVPLQLSLGAVLLLHLFRFSFSNAPLYVDSEHIFSSFALFGFISIVTTPILFLRRCPFWVKIIVLVGIASYILILLLLGTKYLLLSSYVSALLVILAVYVQKKSNTQHQFFLLLAVVTVTVVLALGLSNVSKIIIPNSNLASTEIRPSIHSTIDTGLAALDKSPIKYITGYGAHSFGFVWDNFMSRESESSDFWDTEFSYGYNLMLTFLIEFGLPLFLLLNTLIVTLVALSARRDFLSQCLGIGILFGLYSFWTFTPDTLFIIIFVAAAGVLVGRICSKREIIGAQLESRIISLIVVLVMLLGGTLLTYYAMKNVESLHNYYLGITIINKPNSSGGGVYEESLKYLKKGDVFFEKQEILRTIAQANIQIALSILEKKESLSSWKKDINSRLDEAIQYAYKATLLDPYNYRNHVIYANALLLKGMSMKDRPIAIKAFGEYQEAENVAQRRILPGFLKTKALFQTGEKANATIELNKLMNIFPAFAPLQKLQKQFDH